MEGDDLFVQPGFSITAHDTTAAGDTFCGVLVAALSQNQTLPAALQRANAAGALACTELGAQSSIPDDERVASFLESCPSSTDDEIENLRKYCGF